MLAKPQGFPRKLGGCAGLDPRLRSAVSAGVGDRERGLRRGLRAPGVGVRPKWVLEYSPSNKRIRVLCFNYLCAHRLLDCPQILRRRHIFLCRMSTIVMFEGALPTSSSEGGL